MFNIYRATRRSGPLADEQIDRFDLGTFYGLVASIIPQVGKTTKWFFDLAGKSMALATYLDLPDQKELKDAVRQYYTGTGSGLITKYFNLPKKWKDYNMTMSCLLYTSPSPRDVEESRMPSSA